MDEFDRNRLGWLATTYALMQSADHCGYSATDQRWTLLVRVPGMVRYWREHLAQTCEVELFNQSTAVGVVAYMETPPIELLGQVRVMHPRFPTEGNAFQLHPDLAEIGAMVGPQRLRVEEWEAVVEAADDY